MVGKATKRGRALKHFPKPEIVAHKRPLASLFQQLITHMLHSGALSIAGTFLNDRVKTYDL